jgi:hypothetical protein
MPIASASSPSILLSDAETDLSGSADILVSEIIGNALIDKSVLPAHEHAVRHLVKPEGHVIPARGAVRVALTHYATQVQDLTNVGGFDLSAFKSLARPLRRVPVGSTGLTLRGDPADLFVFDLASARYCPPAQTSVELVSAGGEVNAVVQWIAFMLDEATHYENRPAPGRISAWAAMLHPLTAAVQTVPGQKIRIFGAHDRQRVTIWAETKS